MWVLLGIRRLGLCQKSPSTSFVQENACNTDLGIYYLENEWIFNVHFWVNFSLRRQRHICFASALCSLRYSWLKICHVRLRTSLPVGASSWRLRLQLRVLAYPSSLSGWRVKDRFLAGALWGATAAPALFADSPPREKERNCKLDVRKKLKLPTTLFIHVCVCVCVCARSLFPPPEQQPGSQHLPHILTRCWEGEEKPHQSPAIKIIIFMGGCLQSVNVIFCRLTNWACFYVLTMINASVC